MTLVGRRPGVAAGKAAGRRRRLVTRCDLGGGGGGRDLGRPPRPLVRAAGWRSNGAPYLLALGGSASVGFQPTLAHPRGQPTSSGYAEDLVPLEQQRWPGLTVVHLGCPGATTMTMLEGGGKCPYAEGSQLQAAEAFLRTHPTTALVTVDLGFNDLLSCLRHEVDDTPCVDEALATVHDQLTRFWRGSRPPHPPAPSSSGWATTTPISGTISGSPAGRPSPPRASG